MIWIEMKSYFVNIKMQHLTCVKQIFYIKGVTATLYFLGQEQLCKCFTCLQTGRDQQADKAVTEIQQDTHGQPNPADEGSRN